MWKVQAPVYQVNDKNVGPKVAAILGIAALGLIAINKLSNNAVEYLEDCDKEAQKRIDEYFNKAKAEQPKTQPGPQQQPGPKFDNNKKA